MGVVEERAITVDARIDSFLEDVRDSFRVERGGKLGAARILDAMHRPEDLFDSIEHDSVARLFARMIRGEAAVVSRMPVLRGQDKLETSLKFIRKRNDFIATWNG